MLQLKIEKVAQMATGAFLRHLRRRLLLMIAIAVVPMVAVVLYQAKLRRDIQILEVHEAAWRLTNVIAQRQSQLVESVKQMLGLLAQMPEIGKGKPAACGELLRGLLAKTQTYYDIGVVDAAGVVSCRARDSGTSIDLAHRPLVRRVFESKDLVIGSFQLLGNWQRRALLFGYPILDDSGVVRDVLFAALDVKSIDRLAAETNLPAGTVLTILDRNGTILTRVPDQEQWSGRHMPDAPLLEFTHLRNQATKEIEGLDGVTRLYAFNTVGAGRERGQIHVIVGVVRAIAYREADQELLWSLFWIAMLAATASALAWFVGSKSVVEYVKRRADAEDARGRLAAIVDSSEDGIIGMTLDGVITTWNDGAEQMYGYDATTIVGQSVAILTPPEHRGEIPELMQIVRLGKGINRYESERIGKDGKRIAV
ncbi:MAG TPA: PAS domain S-box protein, partial [Candidatus Binatia bacterium]|nr:PAS domain S-box protein [Candidatus Binatia bacterium]